MRPSDYSHFASRMEKNNFKLDGKPLVIEQPSPLISRIIKFLDNTKPDEFFSFQELAATVRSTVSSIKTVFAESRHLSDYSTTLMLSGRRKKIFGSKAGIKQLIASLNTDEAARSRQRS